MRDYDRYLSDLERYRGLRLSDLRRSTTDRRLMGVCGGIAEWIGVSSLAVRIVFLCVTFLLLPILIPAYFALGLLIDPAPRGEKASGGTGTFDRSGAFGGSVKAGRGAARENPADSLFIVTQRFSKLEERLRKAEAEVTSKSFRISRELKSGGR